MMNEIVMKIILTIVGFITTGIMGFLIAKIKDNKKNYSNIEKSLECLLRSSITKIYYEYVPKGFIPQYEKENVSYLSEQYKELGGNSYVSILINEINNLPIKSN